MMFLGRCNLKEFAVELPIVVDLPINYNGCCPCEKVVGFGPWHFEG